MLGVLCRSRDIDKKKDPYGAAAGRGWKTFQNFKETPETSFCTAGDVSNVSTKFWNVPQPLPAAAPYGSFFLSMSLRARKRQSTPALSASGARRGALKACASTSSSTLHVCRIFWRAPESSAAHPACREHSFARTRAFRRRQNAPRAPSALTRGRFWFCCSYCIVAA